MLLLIDAGNTRIKWALAPLRAGADGLGQWIDSGAVAREALPSLAMRWNGMPIRRVMVSNVAGDATGRQLRTLFGECFGTRDLPLEMFASSAQRGGLRNGYRIPAQLGSDRFASAIGARALFPGQPLVVATCGTATTIDAISADGVFIGGLILPGLRMMAAALASQTAQLPAVADLAGATRSFADNTDDAIVLGCLSAQAGAIERALARHPAARCILSGGAGQLVAPFLTVPSEFIDNLVLIGLQVAATEDAT